MNKEILLSNIDIVHSFCNLNSNDIHPVVCLKNDVQFELKEDETITLQ